MVKNKVIRFTIYHSKDIRSNLGSKKVAFQMKRYGEKPSVIFHNNVDGTSNLVLDDKSYELDENENLKVYTKEQVSAFLEKHFG